MLNRLRRHRWLWVLALTVLSFKLVAGTVCLNDTTANQHAASVATITAMQSVANPSFGESGNGCLLGETGGCHCACAETLPVPVKLSLHVAPVESPSIFHLPAYGFSPARVAPLLRPPIA